MSGNGFFPQQFQRVELAVDKQTKRKARLFHGPGETFGSQVQPYFIESSGFFPVGDESPGMSVSFAFPNTCSGQICFQPGNMIAAAQRLGADFKAGSAVKTAPQSFRHHGAHELRIGIGPGVHEYPAYMGIGEGGKKGLSVGRQTFLTDRSTGTAEHTVPERGYFFLVFRRLPGGQVVFGPAQSRFFHLFQFLEDGAPVHHEVADHGHAVQRFQMQPLFFGQGKMFQKCACRIVAGKKGEAVHLHGTGSAYGGAAGSREIQRGIKFALNGDQALKKRPFRMEGDAVCLHPFFCLVTALNVKSEHAHGKPRYCGRGDQ